jgi:hypothetical protein
MLRFELDRALTFEYVPTRRVQASLPEGEGQADFEAPEAMAEEAAPVSTLCPPLDAPPSPARRTGPSSPAAPPLEMRSIPRLGGPEGGRATAPFARREAWAPACARGRLDGHADSDAPARDGLERAGVRRIHVGAADARHGLAIVGPACSQRGPTSSGAPAPAGRPPSSLRPELPAQPRIPEPGGSLPQSPIEAAGSDPYPEHELLWLRDRIRGELDLVFLVDATSSMGPFIDEAKRRLIDLIDALHRSPLCRSLRLGLVSYRDHALKRPRTRAGSSR